MSTNFGQLKTNIGYRVQDTSTTMADIVEGYINHRLQDVLRRANLYSVNMDYTMTAASASTVVSASTHTLPSDFGKELYVYNSGTDKNMSRVKIDLLEQQYANELESAGKVYSYSIFTTKNSSAASAETSAARVKKIRFWKAPSTDNHFTIPYIYEQADLSSDTDELPIACETAVEYGATSDTWMYKRQFAKAEYYEGMYEKAIQALVWDQDNQPNQTHLMSPLA